MRRPRWKPKTCTCKWDPYDYVDRFCRYLLANTKIPLEQRIAFAKKHFVRNHSIHEKLKGL